MREILKSPEEMEQFARRFISDLRPKEEKATIVGLYGELGSGKTTFTQAVAKTLEVEETVVSPTFVIMKAYEIDNLKFEILNFKFLVHIDAYRLEKSSELLNLGWNDLISNPENLILIEWPERVADIMPEHIRINFNHKSESEREIEIN